MYISTECLLTLLATIALSAQLTWADVSSGSSCSAVLEAGVYNKVASSSSGSSFSQLQSQLCQSYSSYSYSDYQTDRSSIDSGTSSGSSSSSNAYCSSRAASFDAAAQASFLGFGGGGSTGSSSSSSACSSGADASSHYSTFLQASQFSLAMTNIQSYQRSSCGSSNAVLSTDSSVTQLSQIIEPQVYAAYISCLNLYAVGIRFTQTSSYDLNSMSIDLIYKPADGITSPASLYGFNQNGPATCKLSGPDISTASSSSFKASLTPNVNYNVFCFLPAATPTDGKYSDIFIHTSPGGTFHGLIFHSPPVSQLTLLQAQMTSLQVQNTALAAQVASLQYANTTVVSQVQALQNTTGLLQAKVVDRTNFQSGVYSWCPGCSYIFNPYTPITVIGGRRHLAKEDALPIRLPSCRQGSYTFDVVFSPPFRVAPLVMVAIVGATFDDLKNIQVTPLTITPNGTTIQYGSSTLNDCFTSISVRWLALPAQ